MSRNSTLLDHLRSGTTDTTIDRRHLLGGAAGIATAATAAFAVGSLVSAQTATPEAGSSDSSAADRAKAITDRSAAVIAAVKADRDAVASSIDVTTVDELLSLASDLQTQAEAATVNSANSGRTSSGSASGSTSSTSSATPAASTSTGTATTTSTTPGKIELAAAAARTAQAARSIIVAQLATFGLPSQQARLSRKLAKVYDAVKELATTAGTAGVADASTLVTHAEAAYKSAYDAYTAKTYASAAAYGEATVDLGEAAGVLLGLGRGMLGGGRMERHGERGGFMKSAKDKTDSTDGTDTSGTPESSTSPSPDDSSTPVEVPEPSF